MVVFISRCCLFAVLMMGSKFLSKSLKGVSYVKRLQVPTSNYKVTKSDYEWLRMTTSDYESSYEWLQLRLAIVFGIKTFIVSYDYIDTCATLLVKIIKRYLRCRNSCSQMFFRVIVPKIFVNFTGKHLC